MHYHEVFNPILRFTMINLVDKSDPRTTISKT